MASRTDWKNAKKGLKCYDLWEKLNLEDNLSSGDILSKGLKSKVIGLIKFNKKLGPSLENIVKGKDKPKDHANLSIAVKAYHKNIKEILDGFPEEIKKVSPKEVLNKKQVDYNIMRKVIGKASVKAAEVLEEIANEYNISFTEGNITQKESNFL